MADAEAEGIREAGVEVDMYQYVPLPSQLSHVFFHPHVPFHPISSRPIVPSALLVRSLGGQLG